MKFLIVTGFICLAVTSFCQKTVMPLFTEISSSEYKSCNTIYNYLIDTAAYLKNKGILVITIKTKKLIFKDDYSHENFKTFKYLGRVKNCNFLLLLKEEFNREKYYLINKTTGKKYTLAGKPIFNADFKSIACLSKPGTDEQQSIQICKIKNELVYKKKQIPGKKNTFFNSSSCINKSYLYLKDNIGKYWKLNY